MSVHFGLDGAHKPVVCFLQVGLDFTRADTAVMHVLLWKWAMRQWDPLMHGSKPWPLVISKQTNIPDSTDGHGLFFFNYCAFYRKSPINPLVGSTSEIQHTVPLYSNENFTPLKYGSTIILVIMRKTNNFDSFPFQLHLLSFSPWLMFSSLILTKFSSYQHDNFE